MKQLILGVTFGAAAIIAAGCNDAATKSETAPVKTVETEQTPKAPEHIVAQKLTMASGDLSKLGVVLEKLMGEWHQSPSNFNEGTQKWMAENNITGFYDTFSWGTDKGWINFGDYQIKDGKPRKTGTGMISWHSGYNHLRFRETGARGGFVDGMIEIVDDNTFIRHYQFHAPDSTMSYRSDTWAFNPANPNCFIWQTTGYKDGAPQAYPGREFCKK